MHTQRPPADKACRKCCRHGVKARHGFASECDKACLIQQRSRRCLRQAPLICCYYTCAALKPLEPNKSFSAKLILCQTLLLGVNQTHVMVSLGAAFPLATYLLNLHEHNCQIVCWPPAGPQDLYMYIHTCNSTLNNSQRPNKYVLSVTLHG